MKTTVTTQSLASAARQFLAILGITFGVLTQSLPALHLPVALSTALAIGGTVILAIEHYVGDPSTGTPLVTAPQAVPSLPPTQSLP